MVTITASEEGVQFSAKPGLMLEEEYEQALFERTVEVVRATAERLSGTKEDARNLIRAVAMQAEKSVYT